MTLTPAELGLLVAAIGGGGIVLGGLIAGGFALLTDALDSGRQHRRWKREKWWSTHLAYLTLIDRHTTNARLKQGPKTEAEVKDALEGLNEAVSALSLGGPEKVLTASRLLRDLTGQYIGDEKEPDAWAKARADYITTCRKALGFSNRG